MGKMKQLSKLERQEIFLLKEKGYSRREIAKSIGRNVSTISREMKRNSVNGEYIPKKAQMKFYLRWKYRKPYMKKIRADNELEDFIREKLELGWAPEQIGGGWRKEKGKKIGKNSIYRYLESPFGQKLKKYLPYKGRKKKKGCKKGKKVLIPSRIWIDERPEVVSTKKRSGDFEGDTIVSKRGDKTSFLVLLEKRSRYLLAKKVPNKKPDLVQKEIEDCMGAGRFLTITFDNGVEFSHHYKLPCDTYFCHPYSSWEKGQVEYGNRLLRRFFPKKTLLKNVSEEELSLAVGKINNTPRKCLNWNTPKAVFLASQKNPP